jgi:hypothetical protein
VTPLTSVGIRAAAELGAGFGPGGAGGAGGAGGLVTGGAAGRVAGGDTGTGRPDMKQ